MGQGKAQALEIALSFQTLVKNQGVYTLVGQIAHFPSIYVKHPVLPSLPSRLKRTFRGLITPEYHLPTKCAKTC
jgi:hypothetical protein